MINGNSVGKRNLPCGCSLSWDGQDAIMALCIRHSIEYVIWRKKNEEKTNTWKEQYAAYDDNEFVKMVTSNLKEIKTYDSDVLLDMQ